MPAATDYFDKINQLLTAIRQDELDNVDRAAAICAKSILNGGLVFVFGSGHSRMMCEEMTPRQGGFVGFYALVEHSISNHAAIIGPNGLRAPLHLEKFEGYAEEILKGFKFGPNDSFIIVSTSGIRPLIVEMALGVKERGLPIVAMCSKQHGSQAKPAHRSGKKLMDLADVVLDNHCPPGDCVLELQGLEWRTGPASTITGGMLMNMVRVATAEKLLAEGFKPELLPSHHFVGNVISEEQLEKFYEGYRKSLAYLFM